MPSISRAQSITGLVTLDTDQTITGVKTFSQAPVVPDSSFVIAKISATGTRSASTFLAGDGTFKTALTAAPSNMATTDTTQTISGTKTFSAAPHFSLNAWGRRGNDFTNRYFWQSTGSDTASGATNWKRIATLTLPTGLYVAASFLIQVTNAIGNYGQQIPEVYQYAVSVNRSGGTQDDNITTLVRGPLTDYVRVQRTDSGNAELQVRQPNQYQHVAFDVRLTGFSGTTVTWVSPPVDGLTTGTITTATRSGNSWQFSDVSIGALNAASGSIGGQAIVVNNDARLSDARTPTAHTHGVTDLTATGTRSSTTVLHGDNTWKTVTAAAPSNMVTTDSTQTGLTGDKTSSGVWTASVLAAAGLTGATSASRYVGATNSGPPTSGTFLVGDWVIARNGRQWICTASGSPGTWADAGLMATQTILTNGPSSNNSRSSLSLLIEQQRNTDNYKRQSWYFHEPQTDAVQQVWAVQSNKSTIDTYAGFRFYINSSANPGRSFSVAELGKSYAAFGAQVMARRGVSTPNTNFFYGGATGTEHNIGAASINPNGQVESWPSATGSLFPGQSSAWFYRTGSFYGFTIDVSSYSEYAGAERMFWLKITHSVLTQASPTLSSQANGASTLAAGTYFYTVVAVTSTGSTYTANPPSITVTAGRQVTVTWAAPTDATLQGGGTTYEVYRGTSSAAMMRIASGLTGTSYVDTGAAQDNQIAPTSATITAAYSWGSDTDLIGGAATATVVAITDTTTAHTLRNGVKITWGSTTSPRPGDIIQFTAVQVGSESNMSKIRLTGMGSDPYVTQIDSTSARPAPYASIGRFHAFTNFNNADATTQGYTADMFSFRTNHWSGTSSTSLLQDVRYGSGILSGYGRAPFNLAGDRAILWPMGLNADWLGTARGLAMGQVTSNPTSGPVLYVNTSGQLCFRGASGTVTVLAQP